MHGVWSNSPPFTLFTENKNIFWVEVYNITVAYGSFLLYTRIQRLSPQVLEQSNHHGRSQGTRHMPLQ